MKTKIVCLLCVALMAMVMIVMQVQAVERQTVDQPNYDSQIILKSPNGRFRVTIAAANEAAGIWIEDTQDHKIGTVVIGRNESARFIAVSDTRKAPKFALTENGLKDQREYSK